MLSVCIQVARNCIGYLMGKVMLKDNLRFFKHDLKKKVKRFTYRNLLCTGYLVVNTGVFLQVHPTVTGGLKGAAHFLTSCIFFCHRCC